MMINEGLCRQLVSSFFVRTRAGEKRAVVLRELINTVYAQGYTAAQPFSVDAARWRETVARVGYMETGSGTVWTLNLPAPRRSGNTDENFIAAIDAAHLERTR